MNNAFAFSDSNIPVAGVCFLATPILGKNLVNSAFPPGSDDYDIGCRVSIRPSIIHNVGDICIRGL